MNSFYNNPCFNKLPYTEQMAIDVNLIDEYLNEQGIIAEIDQSGLRYVIIAEGNGSRPTTDSTVNVKYRGTLMSDNSMFDRVLRVLIYNYHSLLMDGKLEFLSLKRVVK